MKVFILSNYTQKKLKHADFKSEYERELLINAITKMTVELRHSAKLTQRELARKAKTTQAVLRV